MMSAKTPYKEEKEGSNSLTWDYITFVAGGIDEKILQSADEKLVNFFQSLKKDYEEGNTHIGIIGSGDIWNREKDRLLYFHKEHQVLCEDMEAISIYTIANRYQIPVVAIKMISDNELLGEPYDRSLGKKCQEFVYKGIQQMINQINFEGEWKKEK